MSEETANFHARYLYRGYLQVVECDLTGETPDSCAVTSGTPRSLRPRASCPWRAGKRTGRRRKSISTACTTRWKTSPPSSGKRADAAPCMNTGRTEVWSRRKAIWGKKTGSASRANTWMANWGWSITVLIGINSFDIFGTASFLLETCQRGLERNRIHAEWVLQILLRKSFGILYGIQAASGMFRVQFLCKRVEKDLPLSAFREERKAGAQPEELIFS